MSNVQIIRTESGEELIILPRDEYEALVAAASESDENAADIAMYDARKAELSGTDDALPREAGDLMLRGHTRLKAIRIWRGLVQRDVAAEAGIAQGYLSDLESGRKTGSSETIEKLARILDVPTKWLG